MLYIFTVCEDVFDLYLIKSPWDNALSWCALCCLFSWPFWHHLARQNSIENQMIWVGNCQPNMDCIQSDAVTVQVFRQLQVLLLSEYNRRPVEESVNFLSKGSIWLTLLICAKDKQADLYFSRANE